MYSRILVPTDGSSTATRGVDEAIRLAAALNASIVLLDVSEESSIVAAPERALLLEQDPGRAIVDDAAARAVAAGVRCEIVIGDGAARDVAAAIVKRAARSTCGLIVMGTQGRCGSSRLLLGSDAEAVARSAHVPVLLVGPPASNA